jgi:hypothetical protein
MDARPGRRIKEAAAAKGRRTRRSQIDTNKSYVGKGPRPFPRCLRGPLRPTPYYGLHRIVVPVALGRGCTSGINTGLICIQCHTRSSEAENARQRAKQQAQVWIWLQAHDRDGALANSDGIPAALNQHPPISAPRVTGCAANNGTRAPAPPTAPTRVIKKKKGEQVKAPTSRGGRTPRRSAKAPVRRIGAGKQTPGASALLPQQPTPPPASVRGALHTETRPTELTTGNQGRMLFAQRWALCVSRAMEIARGEVSVDLWLNVRSA